MASNGKNSFRIRVFNGEWQKSIRCNLILKSLFLAAFVCMISTADAATEKTQPQFSNATNLKQTSSGKATPCMPPQTSRMDKNTSDVIADDTGTQRNAGNTSLSYAMALSMALGLRSVAGPVHHTSNMGSLKTPAGASPPKLDRYALPAQGIKTCPGRVSMNY